LENRAFHNVIENIVKLARRINYVQGKFFQAPLIPEDVLVNGISRSKRETLIALGSLLRLSGIAAMYDEVDNALFVHNGREWRQFNLEARSVREALLPVPARAELILEVSRQTGSCSDSLRPSYGVDFGLTKLDGGRRVFLRKPYIVWDDRACALRIWISPGLYEFSVGLREKNGPLTSVELLVKWLSIKAGETIRMKFPEF
jgi:hypothetical protein